MININNIKFKWLNDYDMYKSFIKAIKKGRIPIFIVENSIENFEHNDGLLYTVTMIPEWSLSTIVLEHYINPENNSLKLSVMFGNF